MAAKTPVRTVLNPAGRTLTLGLLLFFIAALAPAATPPEGRWGTDVKAALVKARDSRQPVLIMFSASWCQPCTMMKQNVFTQDRIKRALYDYVAVYIDGDEQKGLMEQYKIQFLPTFLLLRSNGAELGRFVGYNDPDQFLRKLGIIRTDLPALDRQIAANPRDPALYVKRGRLLEALANPDNLDQVYAAYKKAQSLDPQNRTGAADDVAFFDAARITDEGPEAADKRFADFISKYPRSPRVEDALFNRIDIALRLGDDAKAKALLAQYQQRYPKGKYTREIEQIKQMLAQPRPLEGSPEEMPPREMPNAAPSRAPQPSRDSIPTVPERY